MKAVIFDMDGLMFDTESLVVKGWDYAGEKLGVGKLGYMVNKTLGVNHEKTKEIFYEDFKDAVDVEKLTEITREYVYSYYDKYGTPEKPYLHEVLNFLKENNFKLAVASSSRKQTVLKHLKSANILDYFQAIICGDMISNSKPHPEIYLKACEALNEDPSNCYALEDSPNGIRSAHAAKMVPIMIPDLIEPNEEIKKLYKVKLNSLGEFITYIKNNPA